MDKINWVFWIGIIIIAIVFLIVLNSGCAIFQPKPAPIIAPGPAVQMWQTVVKSNWLVTLAIPIIALGAVAMFNGAAKLGMSAVIFGCVNLFMALATARFALWMSIFGLIGSVAAVAVSILSRKRALVEIIRGGQRFKDEQLKIKTNVTDIAESFNTYQACNQTRSTQKIVREIKSNLKIKGEI